MFEMKIIKIDSATGRKATTFPLGSVIIAVDHTDNQSSVMRIVQGLNGEKLAYNLKYAKCYQLDHLGANYVEVDCEVTITVGGKR